MFKTLFLATVSATFMFAAETPGPDPDAALRGLMAGNQRFVGGQLSHPNQTVQRRQDLANGQHPAAIILGCADSRVAPEVVFDQGMGDLFVVRVAGNVVNDDNLGSIEYGVEHLGTRLIVVLGHERCGAVAAAVQGGKAEGHIANLLKGLQPAVAAAKGQPGDAAENVMRANVLRMVALLSADETLSPEVKTGKVKIVGARYDLDTGAVTLLK